MPFPETSHTHAHPRRVGVAVVAAIGGLVLVAFGWLIPSQFKSLPVSVLAEAGRGTTDLASAVRENLDAGRPGAAATLAAAAVRVKLSGAAQLTEQVREFSQANADLALWGEANPFLSAAVPEDVVRRLDPAAGVVRHFLPVAARQSLRNYLSGSRNATARAILATADLQNYHQFLPTISAGGAPLEATVLLAAMLVQSDELGDGATRELRALAEQANAGGDVSRLEFAYLDLLSLGRRYNWGQLAALTRNAQSLDTLGKIRHLHQAAPDSAPVLAGAIILSRRPDATADYLMHYGEHAAEAVAFALYHGAGSLELLLHQQLPVDGNVALPPVEMPQTFIQRVTEPLIGLALHRPTAAVGVKIAAYLLGGLLLFLAGERLTALRRLELSPFFTTAARAVGAAVVCLFLVVINEPYLALGSQPSGFELKLVIPVLGANSAEKMNQTMNAFPVDAATLLSISFFFLLQMLVYLICLLKLREIQSKDLPSVLKLRLVENEENLFDSGLYVGIAGTCTALVLQVLQVIEANLLAAYSSNLFGILCVAFVKIRHVRPFKQRLILQLSDAAEAAPVRVG